MRRQRVTAYAPALLAAAVALLSVWASRGGSALALLLLGGVAAALLAIASDLRLAPITLGIVFVLLGVPLLAVGGAYALVVGALLVAAGTLAPPPPQEDEAAASSA